MVASDVLPTQKAGPHHEEADSCILEEQLQGPQPLTGRTHKNPCVSISSKKHLSSQHICAHHTHAYIFTNTHMLYTAQHMVLVHTPTHHMHMFAHIYAHMHALVHAHEYIQMLTNVHIHTHVHTDMHWTHTHIHTCHHSAGEWERKGRGRKNTKDRHKIV